jgi:hypothetical protein
MEAKYGIKRTHGASMIYLAVQAVGMSFGVLERSEIHKPGSFIPLFLRCPLFQGKFKVGCNAWLAIFFWITKLSIARY